MKNQLKLIFVFTVWLILAQISLGEAEDDSYYDYYRDRDHDHTPKPMTKLEKVGCFVLFGLMCLCGHVFHFLMFYDACIKPCFRQSQGNREARTTSGGRPTQPSQYQRPEPVSNPFDLPHVPGQRLPLRKDLTRYATPKPHLPLFLATMIKRMLKVTRKITTKTRMSMEARTAWASALLRCRVLTTRS